VLVYAAFYDRNAPGVAAAPQCGHLIFKTERSASTCASNSFMRLSPSTLPTAVYNETFTNAALENRE
jgi:hypothetical protein